MSNIQTFNFEQNSVRVEIKNGEPLFCLTDVATILEISNANPSRFNLANNGVHKMYSVDSKGRKNEITFISEPNLYRVIFRSNKAEAVKFQNWVFNEVLPTIRKTGSYTTKPTELTPKEKAECLNILMATFGDVLSKEAKETILVTTTENLLGLDLGYRPQVQKTYSATQIGEMLGISAHKVGKLTNAHNLKTDEYGVWVLDKSAHSSKQLSSFRYFDSVISVIQALLSNNHEVNGA